MHEPQPVFITGADSHFLMPLFALLQSMRNYAPQSKLYVCDFGMSQPVQDFFRALGILLPRPAAMDPTIHAFEKKMRITEFLGEMRPETVVWIDSDCCLTGDLLAQVQELCAQHEAPFMAAVTEEVATVGGFIEATQEKHNIAPFMAMLAAHPATTTHAWPYFNAGFYIAHKMWDWQQRLNMEGRHVPGHFLHEQNFFNYLLQTAWSGEIIPLDGDCWNVHDERLKQVQGRVCHESSPSARLYLGDKPVLFVHTTSPDPTVVRGGRCPISVDNELLPVSVVRRVPCNPWVDDHILKQAFSFIRHEAALLRRCGLLTDAPTVDPTPAAPLKRHDYRSPGGVHLDPSALLPSLQAVEPLQFGALALRTEIPHRFYGASLGGVPWPCSTLDEAHLIFNHALAVNGGRGLVMGQHALWFVVHLALAGLTLDVVDPTLEQAEVKALYQQTLTKAHLLERVRLYAQPQPLHKGQPEGALWDLVFMGWMGVPQSEAEAINHVAGAMQARALLLLYGGLAQPSRQQGVVQLQERGWQVQVQQTMQQIAVAWRGSVQPFSHQPDPAVNWPECPLARRLAAVKAQR
ncbi:hypothetical protein Mmc1_2983 [Magnetococcus marinus MC-1]|uniref:Uncharacterized protein n=1 Tax=Magnetococcus marinus (strain ATCC BAA-1437 / JCM 17883 / MC-1) TaxID=156889 RepID=A0LBY1_MAGMM|nr:hypothetical protein [Magnetococcus marinus]ABK45474.1 hypothetical protein Mmc1_2983 [Magnetococcus marinus MC-1]